MPKKVVLIDNYDSFTWNVYQYLCEEGADVEVYRNDKITVEEVAALKPDTILISPGPGHPKTDSGISRDCIRFFTGKIPIFGVCMGQQCMFDVFGGDVSYAGEIVHGKTSPIYHDDKGIFKNVPQGVAVTRYHSLAGTRESLPDELEVSATTDGGIIMGIRHKKYTIEGVQFHPESILTEEGHLMIKNMLNINGGTWEENNKIVASKTSNSSKESIMNCIYAKRMEDVTAQSKIPGYTFEDLEANFKLGLAPPVLDFVKRLKGSNSRAAVIAEIKRASPSKGDFNVKVVAAKQGLEYAKAGAAAISILTEPHWFKGQLQDLINVRKILDINYASNPNDRPCLLRKEFVYCKYQILEARLAGADSVLLIVKMLTPTQLKELYDYSTIEMGIEPLVEVNSPEDMILAKSVGAKVIGVNNRDLHTFNVDLNTTSNLISSTPEGSLLITLSGILKPSDADKLKDEGVNGFLIGEALMKTDNIASFIKDICA
ncbi:hypothetical protein TBLA_0D03600 [Henningerozyma blattae CBS 6284]|uniref:Multifunctional tryptophan biosynthesis protein n=1 Tax=Henningerozyma blattae (strain ATCC 34711 / CBS 6284 / DSM 70876 / NBRC 10599 / NRRL Y-10934 / UCD 77-7) TaxID=1071380 RepID=I2H3A8_HENB6|nr:hypothetical protein TBLA_0D03600 [Tetrapisispora blattae CBS 6284]CCH60860.1 hypothetical protein TBLA_0D03600 [Tetrapisispora blattae CBS 6284]